MKFATYHFHMRKHLLNISLAVLSGVLGFMAFPPFEISILGWISLAPLLLAVRSCSAKEAFVYSYAAGLVFFSGLLYWLGNVSVPGYLILVLYMAVFYALFGAAANIVFRYNMDIMVLPFIWVVLEYVRAHLFTGFPWGLLGYSQYKNLSFIQIADVAGAYGVSFLAASFNVAMFSILARSRRKLYYTMSSIILAVVALMYGAERMNNHTMWGNVRLSVVQGNIPQEEKWDSNSAEEIFKIYSELTMQAAKDKPDMIIWPESSYPYLIRKGESQPDEVMFMAAHTGVPLLAGIVDVDGEKCYNSAFLFDDRGGLSGKYSKLHLVPWGEYVPFERFFSFVRGIVDKPMGDFAKGEKEVLLPLRVTRTAESAGAITRSASFYKFGVLICFEDVFPYISREAVYNGANFLVNITNDAWFGDTAAPTQHLQASVFRAVENRVPVIRAANTGVSCFISPTGQISSRVHKGEKDIFVRGTATANVDIWRGRTYYVRHGDHFVFFCLAMLGLFLFADIFLLKRFKPSQES